MNKPILCLDFDGVIHSYASGWKGADVIPDPPVPGALAFIEEAARTFRVAIFSSRSNQPGGIDAMKRWLEGHLGLHYAKTEGIGEAVRAVTMVRDLIEWPTEKPPAFLTIDDRAILFNGNWADPLFSPAALLTFRPWNKREPVC
jgi:hypothetical protein